MLGCVPSYVTSELAGKGRSALDLGVFMIRNTRWSGMLLDLLSHRARTSHSTEVRRTSLSMFFLPPLTFTAMSRAALG